MPCILFCIRNFFFLLLCTLRAVPLFAFIFQHYTACAVPLASYFSVTLIPFPALNSTSCIVYFCHFNSFPSIIPSCIVYFCHFHSFPSILHAAPLASCISVTFIHFPALYNTPYILYRLFLSLAYVSQR